ncbi:MAG: hypothetical protein WC519_03185 [Parcubacteria group bacterium]
MANKKKIKRENMIIVISFFLVVTVVAISAYLTGILGKNLNRFLSAGDDLSARGVINFNFEAYEALNL